MESAAVIIKIINKPQPNLHSGDTYLGHEGVPWIEVPLYNEVLGKTNNFLYPLIVKYMERTSI